MASQIEVAQVMAVIGSAYPNFAVSKDVVQVYYDLLNDLPVELLQAAALRCCAEPGRKFAPSVGEIRGAAGELRRKADGIPSTLEAWDEICSAPFRDISEDRPLYRGGEKFTTDPDAHQWSHPLVERVARMLGWPNFPSGEEGVDRAHFFRQYENELARHTTDEVELPLVSEYIESHQKVKQLTKGMTRGLLPDS
jgi:hypothetical protein